MSEKGKKIIIYFGFVIMIIGLIVLWYFQLKINLDKTKNKDEFFSNIKNIYEKTNELYKGIELKELIESKENNSVDINQFKNKILPSLFK